MKKFKVERLPEEKLKKLAIDFAEDRIFTDKHLEHPDVELPRIFMPVMFGAFEGWSKDQIREVGMIYEYLNASGPVSLNGYPVFSSLKVMHAQDVPIFFVHVERIREIKENF